MEDWNDLRLVLAIARSGSLTAAARSLGVAHSTAFRRLGALEARLDVRLFERLPAGVYSPSPAGQRMAATAERVETETDALGRDLTGADTRLVGRLRITCPEAVAFRLLAPCFAEFRRRHPGITLDVAADNRVLSLSRREADVALRISRPTQPDLHGRRVADMGWTLYAAPALLETRGPFHLDAVADWPLIGWEEGVTGINTAQWAGRHAPESAVVLRTNSVLGQMAAAREGVGLALLPCYLGDAEPGLVRAAPQPLDELTREVWLVTHEDLRRTARVRAFIDLATSWLAERREQVLGSQPAFSLDAAH